MASAADSVAAAALGFCTGLPQADTTANVVRAVKQLRKPGRLSVIERSNQMSAFSATIDWQPIYCPVPSDISPMIQICIFRTWCG